MNEKIALEAEYPDPPERVWQALTDAEALSRWLLPTDFKPLIGFRFRLLGPDGLAIKGKVTDVEEGRLLAYTWESGDDADSIVVWTLQPNGEGTKVRVEQIAIEEPTVTCLAIDNYFNWQYALRHSLPGLLRLLAGRGKMPRPPIVYVEEVIA